MIERIQIIDALNAYRARLKGQGKIAKAVVVAYCILIVKRLRFDGIDHGIGGGGD